MISNKGQSTNIKVLCRIRPLSNEVSKTELSQIEIRSSNNLAVFPKTDPDNALNFEFDHIFPDTSNQENVFHIAAHSIVQDLVQGINGTIMAYGQTASGKTHTITGSDIFDANAMGLIPRVITSVFDNIDESDNTLEFSMKISYCELYLEKIYDLTDMDKKGLKIREDRARGFYIEKLTEHFVSSDFEVFEILRVGTENRHLMCTKMNSRSSRSHTIFTINLDINNSLDLSGRNGRLCFVDLAGSERVSKTGAEGLRLKELKNINKSLNSLTSVINALTDTKALHVPYRDSKLTKMLQNSLGGNSKTSIIITVSPLLVNESETISTLRFGAVAKAVKNQPKINRELTMAELKLKLHKLEEELKKKALRIGALEESLAKLNIDSSAIESQPSKNDDPIDFESTESDEFLVELEEASNKLTSYIEDNSKRKKLFTEVKMSLEDIEKSRENDHALISLLENKHEKIESAIKAKSVIVQKLIIEKTVLSEKIERAHAKKLELERTLNEKTAENNDLKYKLKTYQDKQEILPETAEAIEELKEKLIHEQHKYKKNQNELQELQLRLNLALQEQLNNRIGDEKSTLTREINARNDKISALEHELNEINDSTKLTKKVLGEDESSLLLDTEALEKKLKELAEMYKLLVSRQSSSNIEKQINLRKVTRLNERIGFLDQELQHKKEGLVKAEKEANRFLDDMAAQSIFNKMRVPIKGGGGKGGRAYTYSRLSIKPRNCASLKFN